MLNLWASLGQPLERAAEGDARQRRGDLARGAANVRRRIHLRIEGLELRRTPVHEEKDHRLVLQQTLLLGCHQVTQSQAA